MASGERVKVWFKEIENNLASRCHGAITCEELRALALDLTVKMRRFRDQSGIVSPVYYCPSCKTFERAAPPTIHGGSVIFAARRLGLIDDVKLSELKSCGTPTLSGNAALRPGRQNMQSLQNKTGASLREPGRVMPWARQVICA